MTHVQVNGVLSVLRKHGFDVPKDSRTLVKSTRTIVTYKKCGGDYLYFGLRKIITQSLEIDDSNEILNLKVNVDGIPLYKSSSLQFWPILCSINNSTPMIAALFSGNSKPNSVDDFLQDFIYEVKELQEYGFSYNEKTYTLLLQAFICDSPARAFLKNIKGHNSLHGCERCCAVGLSVNHRTIFVNPGCFNAERRTEDKFFNLAYIVCCCYYFAFT
nr:uncharacterized protein LOC124813231 [Hydra vulgaris]